MYTNLMSTALLAKWYSQKDEAIYLEDNADSFTQIILLKYHCKLQFLYMKTWLIMEEESMYLLISNVVTIHQ